MSDGNFRRSLLPTNSFSSGVQIGEARMRVRAIEAFRAMLANALCVQSETERDALMKEFVTHLQSKDK